MNDATTAYHWCGPALQCRLEGVQQRSRALTLRFPHSDVPTPVFMPVGTHGALKGLTYAQLNQSPINCRILLGNTYHLGNRPGGRVLCRHSRRADPVAEGGLHGFTNWRRSVLTDSGGFQMVSLLKLASVTEQGVLFQHPATGTRMMLTPEESVLLQHKISSDIIMALDDVVSSTRTNAGRFRVACQRTLRWIDRCVAAHRSAAAAHALHRGPAFQNLFGILQGGLDVAPRGMREHCLSGMLKRDPALPGYAIGGLAGGESKDDFWRVVEFSTRRGPGPRMGLPDAKPRYLMGVGYPVDVVVCSALGVDMFDSVFPTRTARFGTAFVFDKRMAIGGGDCAIKLRHCDTSGHLGAVDETCPCMLCCRGACYYSRAYANQLLARKVPIACQLITHHNITYMQRLVRSFRRTVMDTSLCEFIAFFVHECFPGRVVSIGAPGLRGPLHQHSGENCVSLGKRKLLLRRGALAQHSDGPRSKRMRLQKAPLAVPTSCPPWLQCALRSAGTGN